MKKQLLRLWQVLKSIPVRLRGLLCAVLLCVGSGLRAEVVRGEVIRVDRTERAFVLQTEGGERVLPVEPGDLLVPYEGRQVRGLLKDTEDGPLLTSVWPDEPELRAQAERVNRATGEWVAQRGRDPRLQTGERVDFALWDQNGQLRQLGDFAGQPVVLNFIFTRCKDARMCPASTFKMNQLRLSLQEQGLEAHLVTISFDPAYDTPGVLHLYGQQRGLDFSRHTLLSGSQRVTRALLEAYGVLTRHQDGTIIHTMTTSLLDSEGRVRWMRTGPDWTPEEFVERLAP